MPSSPRGDYSQMVAENSNHTLYFENITQAKDRALSRYPRLGKLFNRIRQPVLRCVPDSRSLLRIFIAAAVVVALVAVFKGTEAGNHVRDYLPDKSDFCGANVHYDCSICRANDTGIVSMPLSEKVDGEWRYEYEKDGHKLGLSDAQCDAAFPGLFQDLDLIAKKRKGKKVTLDQMDQDMRPWGALRAMIWEGQLFIIDANNVFDGLLFHRTIATLASLHRALVAAEDPKSIPNIEFTMSMHDSTEFLYGGNPNRPMWSYARRAQDDQLWLMPDFGFYSWPEGNMGTMWEIRERIEKVEEKVDFMNKVEKIFWRGAVDTAPVIRGKLVEVTADQEWADVVPIHWDDPEQAKRNVVAITDHCKYMFLAHTEGHSYSGRLKYLQMCHSVIVAHKMEWIQPQNYMMIKSGPQQNYVEVPRDWRGLKEAVFDLVQRPDEARRIAENQVRMFKERYLTMASEACYWRRLMRTWAEFSPEVNFTRVDAEGRVRWRGLPYETFMLVRDLNYGHRFD